MKGMALIYWLFIIIIVVYPNYVFFKKLKNVKTKHILHKSAYFLMSVILPFSIMVFSMVLIKSPYLNELVDLEIDYNDYPFRIIYASVVFPAGILANIYFGKFYLKRISKTKNEIELIGKE